MEVPEGDVEWQLGCEHGARGAQQSQEGPRWPEKGPQTYDGCIYPMIAARFGGKFGAILGYLRAIGANLGVSEGALGLVFPHILSVVLVFSQHVP